VDGDVLDRQGLSIELKYALCMYDDSEAPPPPLPGERLEREANERYAYRWFFAGGLVTALTSSALIAWFHRFQGSDRTAEVLTVMGAVGIVGMALLYRHMGIGIRPLLLGARGEREIGAVLDDLRTRAYFVFNQVPIPRTPHPDFDAFDDQERPYAADNVIVGPAGVYIVETKARSRMLGKRKRIEYDGKRVTENGYVPPPKDCPVRQVTGYATGLGKYLRETTKQQVYVRGVVLYSGANVRERRGTGSGGRPWVLAPRRLVAWLNSELAYHDPSRDAMRLPLTTREIEAIRRAIEKLQINGA